jgi:PAS domain S-box-containing protein
MTTRPLHILLVEDNPADARLFELLFAQREGEGVVIRPAQTLGQALSLLSLEREHKDHPPEAVFDIVLLDLTLPDSEGIDTLRAVRERVPGLPIVVLSGMSDESIALAAVREGAQDYLVKGRIDAEVLGRAVRYAIERKSVQRARDQAQVALAQSEERLRLVTEASTDGVWDWTIATGRVYWSERAHHLMGVAPGEVRRFEQMLALIHPDDRAGFDESLREALSPGREPLRIELRLMRAQDHYGHFRLSGKVVRDSAGHAVRVAGSLADITERKQAEQALRESEQRFQSFMDNSPTIAFMKDPSGRYVYVNAGFEKLFKKKTGELVGRTDRELWAPEIADRLRMADAAVLDSNRSMEFTETLPAEDGPHEWLSFKFPIFEAPNQRFVGGVSVDITERKRAEQALREADEQLRQSQKMEAVGQLASGVAHDFNNLLTAIRGYASLARNTLSEEHPALESLDQVEEASRQATGVAGALLTFARRTRSEKSPANVAQVVESATRLFRRTLPPSVRLAVDIARADELWVMADSTQLQQVIINLLLNARDAITARDGGKGEGTLTIAAHAARPPRTRLLGVRPKPTAVNIVVRDTGIGIAADVKARIFEPFFTTKPRGHGTGLGLAVIHGIVQDHAGAIAVESTPGAGASFTVTLPLCDRPCVQIEPRPEHPGVVTGGLALLAEDNQLVRGLLASMLAALGYDIAHASSAEQAIKVASGIDLPIDLLVVDQDLPGCQGGAQLLADLRARGQTMRAVIVAASNGQDDPLEPGVVRLRKPFQLADLRRAIAELGAQAESHA